MSAPEHVQLIEVLGERFEAIDRRFAGIDQRFGDLGHALAELRADMLGHFDELYRRVERVEQEYHAVTQALRRIEALLVDERGRRQILERDLSILREHVALLEPRISEIERQIRP